MRESDQVVISVLVVVRNEAAYVEHCVESLLNQTFPAERYEVIIVDGQSTDGTREKIEALARRHRDRTIRIFENPKRILSSGWNIGIREARGQYVIRPDAHAVVPHDFLERNMAVMNAHPEAWAVGGILRTMGRGFWGEIIAAAMSCRMGVGGSTFRVGGKPGPADTVVFALYRRERLLQVGGFDETIPLNQDNVCHARLREMGGILYFDPSIESTYFSRDSLQGLWRQMFRRGVWVMKMLKHQRKRTLQPRYLAPLAFVSLVAGLLTCGVFSSVAALGGCAVLFLYWLAGWFSARSMALSGSQKLLVPLVFLTTHTAYGTGSLMGLLSLPFYHPDREGNQAALGSMECLEGPGACEGQ